MQQRLAISGSKAVSAANLLPHASSFPSAISTAAGFRPRRLLRQARAAKQPETDTMAAVILHPGHAYVARPLSTQRESLPAIAKAWQPGRPIAWRSAGKRIFS